ncbi:phosphate acyltransferase [Natranaerofaba carboxydovora]|uniref:phosphate acyltransferase n=1 Tax=Natranaerofaba carboxydovora TaxID=2742683 RepID=UPI001F133D11|nr:phosphate acyltransferase [Natranaerofaba carboxydovora]UMZ72516.1 Phosphate acetyltransferase [Natranaerofaba carboxydovora]
MRAISSFSEMIKSAPRKRIIAAPEPGEKLDKVFAEMDKDGFNIDCQKDVDSEEAVKNAFIKMNNREGDILVQGDISLELFWTLMQKEGLITEKTSYVSILESKKLKKLLMVTDSYVNENPDLKKKINILDEVLAFAKNLGLDSPKVAALSAIESVNPAILSTIEGAALSKMADRKQLNGDIEGPLDIDTALSSEAAKRKGIESHVPGEVDIFLTPDIEAGYALSQFMSFLGKMPIIGVLLGTPYPIVIHPSFVPIKYKKAEICAAAFNL